MKNTLRSLLYIVLFSPIFSLGNDNPPPPSMDGWENGGEPGGQGTGAKAPINDYAGLLIASGFIAATAIYFRKEQLIKKNK